MIVDAHVHAWEKWPWQPEQDGAVPRLLGEMERAGVTRAVVICASLNGNEANNEYVLTESAATVGRLIAFADVDSRWSVHHGQSGIGLRVEEVAQRWGIRGISHYLSETEDAEWLASPLGAELANSLHHHGLVLSIAALPRHMPALSTFAQFRPEIPTIIHHMGGINLDHPEFAKQVEQVVATAAHSNLMLKISGLPHVAPSSAFPFEEAKWLARILVDAFGVSRLVWGSDYPVVTRAMSYADAIEASRRHYDFLGEDDQDLLFAGNMRQLLAETR